ncbi:alpha-hydroxy-acid oxidizing protein [Microbispora sp. CA-102843]|uniref:alpha-hydroxy-acid oxidizing protein n=1 Tax=Microbispora sp. CA-102843 TaxID=3239952 RepID=UPI003D92B3C3
MAGAAGTESTARANREAFKRRRIVPRMLRDVALRDLGVANYFTDPAFQRAVDAGMDGVVVSSHGGRQVDGAVGSLDALPGVAAAVGDRITVLFDSGIRTGADVIKALALGAKAVMLGRPYAYGLGLAGESGVRHVIRCLLAELEISMALAGVTCPAYPPRPDIAASA